MHHLRQLLMRASDMNSENQPFQTISLLLQGLPHLIKKYSLSTSSVFSLGLNVQACPASIPAFLSPGWGKKMENISCHLTDSSVAKASTLLKTPSTLWLLYQKHLVLTLGGHFIRKTTFNFCHWPLYEKHQPYAFTLLLGLRREHAITCKAVTKTENCSSNKTPQNSFHVNCRGYCSGKTSINENQLQNV